LIGFDRRPASSVERIVNCSSTMMWHHDRHASRRAIKAHLEFLIERVERNRREQALKPLYTMIGSAAIVIAWIEFFWRHCL